MTWRPTKYLIEGELDNSVAGIIVGWLRFAGNQKSVLVELDGDFMSDIRGKRLRISGGYEGSPHVARRDMLGFSSHQCGRAGWITAGGASELAIDYPYIEWYSHGNDRVVLMPDPVQVTIVKARDDVLSVSETAQ